MDLELLVSHLEKPGKQGIHMIAAPLPRNQPTKLF
jgi:hypothetical protein